jgi:P-type conjugative transfer protein TrbJ
MNRTRQLACVTTLVGLLSYGSSAHAQGWPVFDIQNYTQNLLSAVRSLEQINNQIRSLQNEATMLENMARNLQPMGYSAQGPLLSTLRQITGLMNQARSIQYNISATDAQFSRLYPQQYAASVTNDGLLQESRARWNASLESFRHTMEVQSQVASNVQADSGTLSDLLAQNQSAVGALQAQQAGNQLTALAAKQQMQIEDLLAAQGRAQAMEQARRAEAEEQARAQFERFLGSGSAYGGQP